MPRAPFDPDRFTFGRGPNGESLVYRPHEVLVRVPDNADDEFVIIDRLATRALPATRVEGDTPRFNRRINGDWAVIELAPHVEPLDVIADLRRFDLGGGQFVEAQLNHIYFANTLGTTAALAPNYAAPNYAAPNYAAPNYAAPNYAAPNYAAPNYAAPNYAAPNYAAPNYAAPNYAAPAGHPWGCGCCRCCPTPDEVAPIVPAISARKARGPIPGLEPLNTFAGINAAQDIQIHVFDVRAQTTVARTAANMDAWLVAREPMAVRVTAERDLIREPGALMPAALWLFDEIVAPSNQKQQRRDEYKVEPMSPELGADVNGDTFVDPAVNHGEFIKGIIDRIAHPDGVTANRSFVRNHAVAGTLGDVEDADLIRAMEHVDTTNPRQPEDKSIRIMNLSLSGYNENDQANQCLAEAVVRLQDNGWLIVAAAGNHSSCRLAWPAALPDVISVAAFGPHGPAWFSNYGYWVDACAPGVDIVSEFSRPSNPGLIIDGALTAVSYSTGYARWSGTSFSTPFVAAMIARWIAKNRPVADWGTAYAAAKTALIEHSDAPRYTNHGTIVSDAIVRVASANTSWTMTRTEA